MKMSSYIRVNTIKAQQVKISNNKDNICNNTISNCGVDKSILIRKNEILREFGKDISNVSGKIPSVNGSIREQIVKNRKTSDIIHKIKNNKRLLKRDPFINKFHNKLKQNTINTNLHPTTNKTGIIIPSSHNNIYPIAITDPSLSHTNNCGITNINNKINNAFAFAHNGNNIHTITHKNNNHNTVNTPCNTNNRNIQTCNEYLTDIFTYLKSINTYNLPEHDYMSSKQTDINERMRGILFDWLVEVHLKFKLLPETLFITVSIIDRYLSKQVIERRYFQLLGITAMFIASKYEEIYSPEMKDYIYMTDNSYSKKQMLQMENDILRTIEFNITAPTPLRFVELLQQFLNLNTKNVYMCQYLIELAVMNYKMIKYSSLLIATCAVYLEKKLNKDGIMLWDEKYESYIWDISGFGKNETDVRSCLKEMCLTLDDVDLGKYPAVKKKYSSEKYMEIANQGVLCKNGKFEFVEESEIELYKTPNKKSK